MKTDWYSSSVSSPSDLSSLMMVSFASLMVILKKMWKLSRWLAQHLWYGKHSISQVQSCSFWYKNYLFSFDFYRFILFLYYFYLIFFIILVFCQGSGGFRVGSVGFLVISDECCCRSSPHICYLLLFVSFIVNLTKCNKPGTKCNKNVSFLLQARQNISRFQTSTELSEQRVAQFGCLHGWVRSK